VPVPLIAHASAVSLALPALAGALNPRAVTRQRVWVIAWSVSSVSFNGLQWLARSGGTNLWTTYFSVPINAILLLAALAGWQTSLLARRTLLAAIPASLAVFLALVLLVENISGFSAVAIPFYSLIGFGAALLTLITRAGVDNAPLFRQDWFWISGGLALYFGGRVALTPFSRLFHDDMVLLDKAWRVGSVVTIVACAIIALGMLCKRPVEASGVSSSPASSASVSQSSPSAPR
jgi:hypothetical protein